MKKFLKFVVFVGAVAGAAWALRDQLMPPPQTPDRHPPAFRTPQAAAPSPEDLTQVNGIGPVRVEQLAELGITTFAALAAADAGDLAEKLGVAESQSEDWIRQAAELG